ncbi:MAG: alpha/beta hydrolase [bacterium]|nr:alpha/beta hydrolase [bacterium]
MKTFFIFHGTGGYPEENWFPWLKEQLEKENCEVIVPQFPTPENQTPESWFKVLDQYRDKLDANTILIGHSLGGSFLLRILESLGSPVKAAFLVATPIGIPPIVNWSGDKPFTGHPFDWAKIKKNSKHFAVYHSDNDPYVGFENGRQLAKNLGVELTFIPNSGHFNAKAGFLKFDDLLKQIELITISREC